MFDDLNHYSLTNMQKKKKTKIFKISDPYVLPDMKNHLLYKHNILMDSA